MPVEKLKKTALSDIDVLSLPFDQYQRYHVVQEIVSLLGLPESAAVLDVGGYPGLIENFLPGHDITITDLMDCSLPNYVKYDGAVLPFEDDSFELVCSCDVLEHVPETGRAAFLAEIQRVSRRYLVITAPFYDERTKLAEEILYGYIRRVLRMSHEVLREHLDNGLPSLPSVVDVLRNGGWESASFPSGYLYRWLPMMMVKHQLIARGDIEDLHSRFDKLYNLQFGDRDYAEPSYRRVVVAAKAADAAVLAGIADDFSRKQSSSQGAEPDLFGLMARLQDTNLHLDLEDFVKRSDDVLLKQIDELHEQLVLTRQKLIDKDKHIDNLMVELDSKLGYRVWAAARKLFNR